MLNIKVTGLLCISMLPVASSCNLFVVIVNFYANIKKMFPLKMIEKNSSIKSNRNFQNAHILRIQ